MGRDNSLRWNDAAIAGIILGLGLLFALTGLLTDREHAAGPQALGFDRLLGLTANVLGLAIVAWWLLTFGLALLAAVLRRTGRKSSANVVAKYSPGFMVRLAFALLSVNLWGGPAAQAETPPEPGWQPAPVSTTAHRPAEWQHSEAHFAPQWKPRAPLVEPGLLGRSAARTNALAPSSKASVVVKDGDTLWAIAARWSGPMATDVDIAMAWPRWYASNRPTIGDDPSVLRPGQVLQPPPD
ncbi:LysM peptidoglycan-binding domain-containing protein [Paenarthrobacter sp. NPDC058040]|uniref:LysM peptidoglycan-binding domain-containing protein n=1 Tax=unclassified Paenarthrobacter TaxID=2634190 RepID=UPI0036D7E1EE